MRHRDHDISAEWVKFDLDALIEVAGVAVKNARAQLDAHLRTVDGRVYMNGQDEQRKNHHAQFYAQFVAEAAAEYAAAWETYHALFVARSRSDEPGNDFEIIIVRKPNENKA